MDVLIWGGNTGGYLPADISVTSYMTGISTPYVYRVREAHHQNAASQEAAVLTVGGRSTASVHPPKRASRKNRRNATKKPSGSVRGVGTRHTALNPTRFRRRVR